MPSYHRRASLWSRDNENHSLCAIDFSQLWPGLAPGAMLVYWTSRSLAADCSDPLPGALLPPRSKSVAELERARARAVRNWAQRLTRAGEGYLTQRRRTDGTFDYRITRGKGVG